MNRPALILLLCAGAWNVALGQSAFVKTRAALPKVLLEGRVRIFYDTAGPHAVKGADVNDNGTPDQVEDIARQMSAAWLLLVEGLGFPDPLKGERYQGAAFLDVHLLNRALLKANGLTYDEIQKFNRPGDPAGTGSLCVDVATSTLAPMNLTPAHELFHVIQNGATYFKTKWFTEGTARWSEAALGAGGAGGKYSGLRARWPLSEAALKAVFEMSYDASPRFWEPLAVAMDSVGRLKPEQVPAAVREMRYVNGEPVLKDLDLNGWEVMRDLLVELGKIDDQAFAERKLDRWSEEEQKSPRNSPYIYEAVQAVMGRRFAVERPKGDGERF